MPFPNGKSNILVEQPTYYGMIKALELNNISALGIERGLNGINLDALENMFKYGDIKFFYTIPRFHNPTGTSYNKHEKQAIVKMAEKYNVYIVEDDIVADLETDKKNDPMFAYDTSEKVIYLKNTISTFNLPNIKWNIPVSGYFSCIYVDKPIQYDKVINSLQNENIELLNTNMCFLKEYKNDNYFRISISKVNEDKIKKGIPIVLNTIQKYI